MFMFSNVIYISYLSHREANNSKQRNNENETKIV